MFTYELQDEQGNAIEKRVSEIKLVVGKGAIGEMTKMVFFR